MNRKQFDQPVLPRISVTVAEAAQMLGIGRTGVFSLLRDGTLKGFKVGKRRLISIRELEALLVRLQKGA